MGSKMDKIRQLKKDKDKSVSERQTGDLAKIAVLESADANFMKKEPTWIKVPKASP